MPANYTERELDTMREQAIKSAREMQRRAVPPNAVRQNASYNNANHFKDRMIGQEAAKQSPRDPEREKQERLNMLVEEVIREASANSGAGYAADAHVADAPHIDDSFVPPDEIFGRGEAGAEPPSHGAPPPAPALTPKSAKNTGVEPRRDNDVMFITAIIIILLNEKADFLLILAMMYILM